MFIVYIIIKKFNLNINFLNDINSHNKITLIINSILGIIIIASQSYLTTFYNTYLPPFVAFLGYVGLISYFFISIFSLIKSTKLEITTRQLESAEEYNKTLSILHDSVRGFKHDFDNIVSTIGGYIATNDMEGLNKYYLQLLDDCQRTNNLYTLNPNVINNPRCIQFID